MTVPSDVNKHIYAGNGVTRVWPYTFLLYDASHLQVWVKRGEEESVQLSGGFTLNELEKTVTYPPEGAGEAPLSADDQIIIMRVVPVLQSTELENQGEFFAKTIEMQFDLIVMMIQQIAETLGRAAVGPIEQTEADGGYQTLLDAIHAAEAARDAAKLIAESLAAQNEETAQQARAYMEQSCACASCALEILSQVEETGQIWLDKLNSFLPEDIASRFFILAGRVDGGNSVSFAQILSTADGGTSATVGSIAETYDGQRSLIAEWYIVNPELAAALNPQTGGNE